MKAKHNLFSVQARISQGETTGRHLLPLSPHHFRAQLNRLALGKVYTLTISETAYTRSSAQLAYHFALIGYIADYSGMTKDEAHDAVMRLCFGEKEVSIGSRRTFVRRSISDSAKMPTADAVRLIDFDLELCRELEIVVPTREQLGYLPA